MWIDSRTHANTEVALRSLDNLTLRAAEAPSDTVIGVTSIVESLVDSFIDLLVAESGADATPLGRRLIERSTDSFHQSWPDRNGWLDGGFGIALAGTPAGQRLDMLVEVRNAIVHGQGRLTDRQVRKPAFAMELRRRVQVGLASQIEARRILLGRDAGPRAITIGREYLLALDLAVAAARTAFAIR